MNKQGKVDNGNGQGRGDGDGVVLRHLDTNKREQGQEQELFAS